MMKQREHAGAPIWWRPGIENNLKTESKSAISIGIRQGDSAVPFWALMAFVFILLISPQSFITALAPLHLALVTALLTMMAYLLDRFKQHRPIVIFNRENIIVFCLIGWAILTLPLSYWPGGSIGVFGDLYFKTIIIFWLLSHVINTVFRLRRIAWGVSLMVIPIALTAVAHFLSGNFIQSGIAPDESRILGYSGPLTGNPNDLALTLNLFLPLSVALFLGSRAPAVRIVLLFCIVLEVAAIIATFSRAGFLTLFVIFTLYLWELCKRHKWHWVIVAVYLPVAAIPFLPMGYLERLGTITHIEADPTGSAQARWGDTLAAIKYIADNPIIGAGLGVNVLALNKVRGPTWTEIHNVYLQYGVDLGIPGLVLFIILLRSCIKSARDAQSQSEKISGRNELYYLAQGIRISLIAFSVAAFFHPVGYHFYFYFIAGLALAARSIAVAERG